MIVTGAADELEAAVVSLPLETEALELDPHAAPVSVTAVRIAATLKRLAFFDIFPPESFKNVSNLHQSFTGCNHWLPPELFAIQT